MTAVAVSRPAGFRPARLLRLEIKHSPFLWALPVLAALFYYDTYRTSAGLPPIWTIRATVVTDHMLNDFSVFAAGLAAWAGSREGRRKTGDLLAPTVRAAWARRATVFAPAQPTGAQEVVVTALMAETGSGAPLFGQSTANGKLIGPTPAQVGTAATRFESLSKAAQHDWLATYIADIRAGGVTLAQIP